LNIYTKVAEILRKFFDADKQPGESEVAPSIETRQNSNSNCR